MYSTEDASLENRNLVILYNNGFTTFGTSMRILDNSWAFNSLYHEFSIGKVIRNFLNPTIVYYGDYNGKSCYIISTPFDATYISREDLLPVAIKYKAFHDNLLSDIMMGLFTNEDMGGFLLSDQEEIYEYEYSLEPFDEAIFEIPNFSEYNTVTIASSANSNEKNFGEPTRAVAGLDINPGERWVVNIPLNEDEVLDYYSIEKSYVQKPNSVDSNFGIINILDVNTYRKIREIAYRNLPELTEEDFVDYTAEIAYKTGYKLTFAGTSPSSSAGVYENYFVNLEETEDPSILLIVRPNTESYYGNFNNVNVLEKVTETNIGAEEAVSLANDSVNELKELVGASESEFGKMTDELINVDFSKIELQAVKGTVPTGIATCWQVEYGDGTGKILCVLMNASNGEIIGATYAER